MLAIVALLFLGVASATQGEGDNIELLSTELQYMRTKVQAQSDHVMSLERQLESQEYQLEAQREQAHAQKQAFTAQLEAQRYQSEAHRHHLASQKHECEAERNDVAEKFEDQQEYHYARRPRKQSGTKSNHSSTKPQSVMFYAAQEKSVELNHLEVLRYNHVITSVPTDVYNATTGDFICPISGYYQFTLTLLNPRDRYTKLYLSKNRAEVMYVRADGRDHHGYKQASNTAIVHCSAGERVNVRGIVVKGEDTCGVYGSEGRYTSWSGFLLHAD